jgi:hypothetical protein
MKDELCNGVVHADGVLAPQFLRPGDLSNSSLRVTSSLSHHGAINPKTTSLKELPDSHPIFRTWTLLIHYYIITHPKT